MNGQQNIKLLPLFYNPLLPHSAVLVSGEHSLFVVLPENKADEAIKLYCTYRRSHC